MQTCPSASDGPSIVVNAVEDAHRALVTNPSTPLPPPCVLSALARLTTPLPDSLEAHAIGVATELGRRGGNQRDLRDLRESEVLLYSRAHRYADASRAYDALVTMDPQPSMDVSRMAIVAAHERGDTAALVRLLTRNAPRADAPAVIRAELNVQRQLATLHDAIAEARGLVRQNPKYLAAYPSLIGNFGTLGVPDSVAAYIRRALAQGTTRASLTTSVDPLVNTMLRQATLYGSAYGWGAPIAAAARVDSVLTTPSTKFLIASLIVQSVDPQVTEIGGLVNGTSFGVRPVGGASASVGSSDRAAGCARIAPALASLARAEAHMREGGERYSGGGAAQVAGAISAERSRLTAFQDVCGR
jgi:hypothetical protein